ncbi:MAG: TolC family protein, partial [Campylobacteraceae bacterium]|nr:TolC family protein [Campylobacteraceae bacterium]
SDQAQLLPKAYIEFNVLDQKLEQDKKLNYWWHQFNQPQMNRWVEQALIHNFDLKLAAANVLESQALLDSAFGSFWPSMGVDFNGSRENVRTSNINNYSTRYGLNLSLSWQLDLFGRLRYAYNSAQADLSALEKDL